jgi:Uma2 family endonuclease
MSEALALPPPMSVEEFLAWPGDGVHPRHQLIDGQPVPMSPASWMHSVISAELATRLNNHFRAVGSPCRAGSDPGVQPRAGASRNVRVPDVAVSCGPNPGHLLREPVLLAEILSPSNERETREAVRAYLSIPSVREVLVLASLSVTAELLRRQPDGNWPEEPTLLGANDELVLESFEFRCPLAALYPS